MIIIDDIMVIMLLYLTEKWNFYFKYFHKRPLMYFADVNEISRLLINQTVSLHQSSLI